MEGDDEDYESETETVKQSFEIDMKLEAEDPSNSSVFYVATVSDVSIKKDIHLQLDGCRKQYWCSSYSTKIHPIGWCEKRNIIINPPEGKRELFLQSYVWYRVSPTYLIKIQETRTNIYYF